DPRQAAGLSLSSKRHAGGYGKAADLASVEPARRPLFGRRRPLRAACAGWRSPALSRRQREQGRYEPDAARERQAPGGDGGGGGAPATGARRQTQLSRGGGADLGFRRRGS